jgi:hypothetical protein
MLVDAAAAKRQDQTLPPLSSYGRSLLEIYQQQTSFLDKGQGIKVPPR